LKTENGGTSGLGGDDGLDGKSHERKELKRKEKEATCPDWRHARSLVTLRERLGRPKQKDRYIGTWWLLGEGTGGPTTEYMYHSFGGPNPDCQGGQERSEPPLLLASLVTGLTDKWLVKIMSSQLQDLADKKEVSKKNRKPA